MWSYLTNLETLEMVFKKDAAAAAADDDDDLFCVGWNMSVKGPAVDRHALTSSLFCKVFSCPE